MSNDGELVGPVVTFPDVSDRKTAEREPRRSQEDDHEGFVNAACGIDRSKPGGALLDVNPALVNMLGYSLEREKLLLQDQARRAKADSESAKAVLLQTLERISDGFFALDRDWCYRYINQQAARYLGGRSEDLIGKNIRTEPLESVDHPYSLYRKALDEQVSISEEVYFEKWKDGLSFAFTLRRRVCRSYCTTRQISGIPNKKCETLSINSALSLPVCRQHAKRSASGLRATCMTRLGRS
jgi:PAS domain S-box-containing protein